MMYSDTVCKLRNCVKVMQGFLIGNGTSLFLFVTFRTVSILQDDVVREYLTRFPYSLPCLVNLLICLLSAVFFYFLVPETLGMKKQVF